MAQEIDNPEEELAKVTEAIKKYEVIIKSTSDKEQQHRVRSKLRTLKNFREKLLQGFEINEEEIEPPGTSENQEKEEGKFLRPLLKKCRDEKIADEEIQYLSLYFDFFVREFLTLFSGRKLKLDFQHSIERDSFYHRFQDIRRRINDFIHELNRIHEGIHRRVEQIDMRKRSMKMKRVLTMEANRLFKSVASFSRTLLDDLEDEGLICLNGDESIIFDQIEGKMYLKGKTVLEALEVIHEYCVEVLSFLNVPEFDK